MIEKEQRHNFHNFDISSRRTRAHILAEILQQAGLMHT